MVGYEVLKLTFSASILLFVSVQTEEVEYKDYYPIGWSQVDFKPIIDNERLYKKYKECIITDMSMGCPRDVLAFKKIIPEIIETLCAKCLPAHIEQFKKGIEYVCHKRRHDYDEIRKLKDPQGELQIKFENKFGKVNC